MSDIFFIPVYYIYIDVYNINSKKIGHIRMESGYVYKVRLKKIQIFLILSVRPTSDFFKVPLTKNVIIATEAKECISNPIVYRHDPFKSSFFMNHCYCLFYLSFVPSFPGLRIHLPPIRPHFHRQLRHRDSSSVRQPRKDPKGRNRKYITIHDVITIIE